jgi:hypothetical protein
VTPDDDSDEPVIDHRYSGPARLGIRYCIDTNVFIDRGMAEDVDRLFELAADGWVNLAKADTLDTERIDGADQDLVDRRLLETAGIIELLGPRVLDHSRLDYSVLGSEADAESLDEVWEALFPNLDRSTARKNHVRDAMHINTARRYGCDAFVTNERRLLDRANRVDGIWIASPSAATERVIELRRRYEITTQRLH